MLASQCSRLNARVSMLASQCSRLNATDAPRPHVETNTGARPEARGQRREHRVSTGKFLFYFLNQ